MINLKETPPYCGSNIGSKAENKRNRLLDQGYTWNEMSVADGPLLLFVVKKVARTYRVSKNALLVAYYDLYAS